MDDKVIIKRVLNGETDLYEHLMRKYHNEIFSYVYNMVGQYQDTEDLLQDIFFTVYQKLKKYDESKASFRTWLYKLAANHTINFLKSAHKKHQTTSEVDLNLLSDNIDLEESLIKDEQVNTIITLMRNTLSKKHQQIFSLHYFSNLSVKEISEVLDIPQKTIYKALKTSVIKIKKEVNAK